MSNEVKEYTNGIARQRVASICLALGWNSAHNSALEVLQDLMVRYIKSIGLNMKNMAELDNRTQPDLYDAFRALVDMNISLEELSEYVEQFDSKALITDPVPMFPQPSETRLNHLKPGSQEVLRRPVHVHQHLPPMYPEMEVPDEPMMKPSLHEDNANVIKKEAGGLGHGAGGSDHAQVQDSSTDLHPLREIASVMMTPHGFISPAREGRMPESRTPAVSRMVSQQGSSTFDDSSSRPGSTELGQGGFGGQGPTKAKPSKPADDTSDEGLIEDDDDDVHEVVKTPSKTSSAKEKTPKQKQNKLSVFQQKQKSSTTSNTTTTTPSSTKKATASAKPPKPPKAEKMVKDPTVKKQGPGRPKGRTNTKKEVSKEFVQSSDDDSSPERNKTSSSKHNRDISSRMSSPPAKKARTVVEPPVEINVDISAIPAPDPNVLPNNPLIPKFFGFENINQFDVKREKTPEPVALPPATAPAPSVPPTPAVASGHSSSSKSKVDVIPKKSEDVINKPLEVSVKESKEVRKEKKLKDKAMKKAKKEKKEKHREKDKEKHKDKSEKKDKEKKKKKERDRPENPPLFAGTDQTTTSVPKLKIKDVKPEESKPPKIVIKNLGDSSSSSKPKNILKQPELFTDPSHIERPKSAASDHPAATATISTGDHHPKIKIKKDKKKDSDPERKRTTSGGGKRQVEKRGSAIAAEAAIHATPEPAESTKPAAAVKITPAATSAGGEGFDGGSVVTQTVGYYVDADGNQIWICPACGKQDDGSPMIGCDECDDWYHWMCVGIQQEPADNQDWFCPRCVAKKAGMYLDRKTPGKRGRPPKLR